LEIRILDQKANPLLKRQEVQFEVAHATAATPQRDAVRGELAKLLKAPKDRVVVERMRARFGTAVTLGVANVYDTTEAAKAISREHILIRNNLKEKSAPGKPAAEAPAAEPAATTAAAPAAAPPKE
jgi:small subunit ribosomal protein S24e